MILHRASSQEVLQNTGAVAVLALAIFLVIRVVGYFCLVAEVIIPTNSVLTLLHFLVALIALYLFRRKVQNRALFTGSHGTKD